MLFKKAQGSVVSNPIGMKFGMNVLKLLLNTHMQQRAPAAR